MLEVIFISESDTSTAFLWCLPLHIKRHRKHQLIQYSLGAEQGDVQVFASSVPFIYLFSLFLFIFSLSMLAHSTNHDNHQEHPPNAY